jgi:hypothetical protein
MKSNFKFFQPDQLNNWHQISSSFSIFGPHLKDAAFGIVNLAESASDFFRGSYPSTPYFPDDYIRLPWHNEYHTTDDAGGIRRSGSIVDEVARVAAELGEVDPSEYCPSTYDSRVICASNKTVLLGLAVETMLLADGCVNLLMQAKVASAFPWSSAAYRRIMDCARQAQEIVDLDDVSLERATEQEINPTKRRVWQWYERRKDAFSSLDRAAEALVGWEKLEPISVATARKWIGEWVDMKGLAPAPRVGRPKPHVPLLEYQIPVYRRTGVRHSMCQGRLDYHLIPAV